MFRRQKLLILSGSEGSEGSQSKNDSQTSESIWMIVPFIIIRTLGERRKKEFEEEGLDLGLT